jgi:uncharacterized membrane protein
MASSRRRRVWIALSALYLLVLVAVALFYLLDPSMNREDRFLATVGIAGIPAAAFVVSAVPLLRGSRNRALLAGSAAFAVLAAFLQLMLTFGFALPLSLVLLGLAAAAAERAARLGGVRASRRWIGLAVAIAFLFVAPAFGLTIAAGVAIAIVVIGLFKLASGGPSKRDARV